MHNQNTVQTIFNDMNNLSLKSKSMIYFDSLDMLKEYVVSLKPNWTTFVFHGSLGGSGITVIVSKTTDLYSAMLVFGYGHITLYSLINGVWSSRDL